MLLNVSCPGEKNNPFGFWGMDGNSETFVRYESPKAYVYKNASASLGDFLPDKKHFLLFVSNFLFLYDMENIAADVTPIILTSRYEYKSTPEPLIKDHHALAGTIYNDFLWGKIITPDPNVRREPKPVWARVALDGKSVLERLPVPKGIDSPTWCPEYCIATPNNKGLLVGDEYRLVLLRFDSTEK
ncbi:MAG: hypothetical protein LBI18_15370 [Planctomycetaceae bacterium]|nr:hypothetical protein [Planctomycetaceae bacterium]